MTSEPGARRPKLLCSTVSLFGTSLHQAFPLIADAGFEGVEVMVTRDPDTRDPDRLRELSEDHGLVIEAIHAPFLVMSRTVWGTDPVAKISRATELAERVGARLVVVHPPYRWQTAYRRWLDEDLPGRSETEVRIAIENMFPVRVRGRKVVSVHGGQSLEHLVRHPDVVLDTSHAAVAGLDLFETVSRLGDRLSHIHLSNNAGRGWDSHLPVDQGVLPLDRFLGSVATEGFHGAISLELDLRRYRNDLDRLRRVLAHNRRFCESRLSLAV
ncbi:MAG TPA: sugar phosphate isomerase/epimerase family protein [Actinomycetota bacterium]|nr:sugar phosphate isomerase/epimerase family protein [Actinomycetota bacterium]